MTQCDSVVLQAGGSGAVSTSRARVSSHQTSDLPALSSSGLVGFKASVVDGLNEHWESTSLAFCMCDVRQGSEEWAEVSMCVCMYAICTSL
jgi:hypothetical protein